MKLSKLQLFGLVLGVAGFVAPLLVTLPGLSFAGHMALGIFLMAAAFWMFEPVPIYSTSILIILLEVLLLSSQGPVYSHAELPVESIHQGSDQGFELPSKAVSDKGVVYSLASDGHFVSHQVSVKESRNGKVYVDSDELKEGEEIVSDASHRLVGYTPNSYADYLATLASPIIILFLGGFVLAEAAVKYNLDRNLTRLLLRPFGTQPKYIILGLMLVTAALSAFMSNTATTAMMMTVILPIISSIDKDDPLRFGIVLCIPFAANIGGITTPIGTPPNAVVIGALTRQGTDVAFSEWMILAVPVVMFMLLITWLLLTTLFPTKTGRLKLNLSGTFDTSLNAVILYGIFGLTVLAWVTESIHGINSKMIALVPVAGLTLFGVIDKDEIRNLPWEVLWLVAGGLALGIALNNTGLAQWMISSIEWGSLSRLWLLIVFGGVAIVMSNFLSNTVTATLLIPLAVSLEASGMAGVGFDLLITSLVIGIGASLAMVLPISTPPNAITLSTGMVQTKEMAKVGVIIGAVGLIMMIICAVFYWPLIN